MTLKKSQKKLHKYLTHHRSQEDQKKVEEPEVVPVNLLHPEAVGARRVEELV